MGSLFNIINRTRGEEQAIAAMLSRLEKDKQLVRVEIENTLTRFSSLLLHRKQTIVIAKPYGLNRLEKGSFIRFRLPGDSERSLRLEVITPHFTLTNGTPVFLCARPSSFAEDGHNRSSDRFNTSRFTNVNLVVPELKWKFRVLDLSHAGARVYSKSKNLELDFPIGQRFTGAYIQLGKHVKVRLDYLTPRSHRYPAVGLEFSVTEEGSDHLYFAHLLENLEKHEKKALKAEPLS